MGNFLSRTIIRPAERKKKTLNLGYLSKLQIVFVQIAKCICENTICPERKKLNLEDERNESPKHNFAH